MPLDPEIRTRLLTAMEAQDLVLLCGAGLSVSPPSCLKSAVGLANICYDEFQAVASLDPALRDDLDELAGHFYAGGNFSYFLNRLVPWDELTGQPNAGHAAVGDFILTGAAAFVMSANFDALIEHWCQALKVFVQGSLTGIEANQATRSYRPVLKFHGCMQRGKERTLWTKEQLNDAEIAYRVQSCRDWMGQQLPNRHLLVLGFWTDWGYLNEVLSDALDLSTTASVTVVDPKTTTELSDRAPELWAALNSASHFIHIQAGADEILPELRVEFSRVWARRFLQLGRGMFEAEHGPAPAPLLDPGELELDALYDLRRDAEAKPANHAARTRIPPNDASQAAFAHLLLRRAGAQPEGAGHRYANRSIRVVNGGGRSVEDVRAGFSAPPAVAAPDMIICAGAQHLGLPANVVRSGVGRSIVRPTPNPASKWLTLEDARRELAL